MQSEELVTVGVFFDPVDAYLAKGRLEEAGLVALLTGEEVARTLWSLKFANGAIRLQVWLHEAEQARKILADPNYAQTAEEFDAVVEDSHAEEAADDYGSPNEREADANRVYRAAMIGIPYFFLQPFVTWSLWKTMANSNLPLRPEYARRLRTAWCINLAAISIVVFCVAIMFLRPHH